MQIKVKNLFTCFLFIWFLLPNTLVAKAQGYPKNQIKMTFYNDPWANSHYYTGRLKRSPIPNAAVSQNQPSGDQLKKIIVEAALANGIDPALALGEAETESHFNINYIHYNDGGNGDSVGLYQLKINYGKPFKDTIAGRQGFTYPQQLYDAANNIQGWINGLAENKEILERGGLRNPTIYDIMGSYCQGPYGYLSNPAMGKSYAVSCVRNSQKFQDWRKYLK